jgi:DNA (cytosine-5)-methyltransferase 1
MTLTMIDLFCGVGGLSIGFESAGFTVLGGNDFDDDIVAAYQLNHPNARTWPGRIETLDPAAILEELGLKPGQLDVLAGGPPCQGFSRNRARRHIRGEFVDDARNYLFKEFLRFAEAMRPRAILIENVADMIIKLDGKFEREIAERLDDMGYHYTSAKVLNAADFGVPQRRRRAFILAGREKRLSLPEPTHSRFDEQDMLFSRAPWLTIWDAIGDLPSLRQGEGRSPCRYDIEPFTPYQKQLRGELTEMTEHVAWSLSVAQNQRLSYLGEGDGAEKLPPGLAPKSGYGSAYRRMARDIPALTITTWMYHPGSGMYFHPVDGRTITIREAARLQSFPDSTKFVGGKVMRCRQVGNAVPPLLARAIAENLRQQLS